MKDFTRDTAAEYDDMVGFESKRIQESEFETLLGDEESGELKIRPKPRDPDFPEEWQSLFVNFASFEDYASFMLKIGQAPVPKLSQLVYTAAEKNGLDKFFG